MRVLIFTPAEAGSTKGNRITAERWQSQLQSLGWRCQVSNELAIPSSQSIWDYDCSICLHATRSEPLVRQLKTNYPARPVVICLTGTDLHLDLAGKRGAENQESAERSLQNADAIVALEPQGVRVLPPQLYRIVTTIYQSAIPVSDLLPKSEAAFEVCILGHLRTEKDPFLAAIASTKLPEHSTTRIRHFGSALSDDMRNMAEVHQKSSPRYKYFGPVTHSEAQRKLAQSHLMISSSVVEGAPSAISEAIVNGVPILATRIPSSIGLLGEDYPGLFEVGNTEQLADLIWRSEIEPEFYVALQNATSNRKHLFEPDFERTKLSKLIRDLVDSTGN